MQCKRALKRFVRPFIDELGSALGAWLRDDAVSQKTLMQHYRLLASTGKEQLPDIRDVGFRRYSQFEEDGILLYIFSLVPPTNRKCIEIGAGNGRECNTANLIINHGWWGYLFDGNEENTEAGIKFFAKNKDTFLYPPRFTNAWVTAEDVNDQIEQSGCSGPVDLLSLDIDGMDYWIWKAISVIEPRVVVCETHNAIPLDKALTVPYEPRFVLKVEDFHGASLAAMCKLGQKKGYRLIGTHRFGFNAFFMKDGVGEEFFPAIEIASCVSDPYSELARKERWQKAKEFNWLEV